MIAPPGATTAPHLAQAPVPERRYSEEEVRRILADAVEVDSSTAARAEGGLTVEQIRRVAAEAGLSQASVTTAIATLDHVSAAPATPRLLGLPVGVASTVVLPGAIADAEWRRLVGFLQDTFEARGREEHGGGRREWRNGNLRIALEAVDGATLLHLRTRKESARSLIRAGGSVLLGSLVFGVASTVATGGMTAIAGVLAMGVGGLAMAAAGALQIPSWSSERQRQFQAVADYARSLSARHGG
jgi:hypothetical protein